MTHMVFCTRLKKELPGLDSPPFPGPAGQSIYDNVSAEAWSEWLAQQTMLINEKQLNMMDKEARQYISEQRERFLSGQQAEQAEGYVAPESNREN